MREDKNRQFFPSKAYQKKLRGYQKDNYNFAINNPNEEWFWDKLRATKWRWECGRQGRWAYRMFDFWLGELGVAIEIDGPEHDPIKEAERDKIAFEKAGIIVLRVRNKNEKDAVKALRELEKIGPWKDRQAAILKKGRPEKGQFRVRAKYDYRDL